MAKVKYGIDLGTTNSSIATLKDGNPFIFQSELKEDVIPSCVSFTRGKVVHVGFSALNDYYSEKKSAAQKRKAGKANAFIEFKRTMGTDRVYESSYMKSSYKSEDLSAEVLKKLRSFVTDDNVRQVIITVPAKFTLNQKAATVEAAKKAGFTFCQLLQEPLAASFAYGLSADSSDDGVWLVFDFGGGTFDAALIHNEDGVLQVFDTEGDNYLGGKDLDYAIVDAFLISYLEQEYNIDGIIEDSEKKNILRESLKIHAENIRKVLSSEEKVEILTDLGELGKDDNDEEMELDIELTREDVFPVIDSYYQRAVDMCADLMKRNDIKREKLSKVILVGGPTFCPLVRDKLREQICENIDTSINPLTAVAVGASLYAQTIDGIEEEEVSQETVQFDFNYESTTVSASEWLTFQCRDLSKAPKGIHLEISRNDGAWSSGRLDASSETGDIVELPLVENRANSFTVKGFDNEGSPVDVSPKEISIISGTKVSKAVLPYNICYGRLGYYMFEIVFEEVALFGNLKKNSSLPTVGIGSENHTYEDLNEICPLKIPLYQADFSMREGDNVLAYDHVADIVIRYEDVKQVIPAGTPVTLKLKIDASEMMEIEASFPSYDLTVTKPVEISTNKTGDEAKIVGNRITDYFIRLGNIIGPKKISSVTEPWWKLAFCEDVSNDDGSYLHKAQEIVRKAELVHRQYKRTTLMKEIEERFEKIEEFLEKDSDFYKHLVAKFGLPSSGAYNDLTMEELRDRHFKFAMETDHMISSIHNAQFFANEYEFGAYLNYKNPKKAKEIFEKMNKIGFFEVDNPELYALALELKELIPSDRVRCIQNNKLY